MYDKDGRGVISVKEMRHLLTSVGEKLSDEEADELLKMTGCVKGDNVEYDSKSCIFMYVISHAYLCVLQVMHIYICNKSCIFMCVISKI